MSHLRGQLEAAGKPLPDFKSWPEGKSLTKQSFAEECDINLIIARAEASGAVGHLNGGVPVWADVSDVPDYRASLDVVREADSRFMELPALVRRRFNNDPAELLAFVADEKNRDEAERMGLLKPKAVVPAPGAPAGGPGSPAPVVAPTVPPK